MGSTKWISKKVAILGSHAVGKTSLISRYIYRKFPENYLTTIGLKVDKKTLSVNDYEVDMIIWDIAGQDNVSLIPPYYLNGCSGIIYVVDLSRSATYNQIETQLAFLRRIVSDEVDIVIAANKSDLLSQSEILEIKQNMDVKPDVITSAKLGEHVDELFRTLAEKMVQRESQRA